MLTKASHSSQTNKNSSNKSVLQTPSQSDTCEGCSNCSDSSDSPDEECCSECISNRTDNDSVCERGMGHYCAMDSTSSSSKVLKCSYGRQNHHKQHCSDESSWQEELKSLSTLSDGNSSISYNNNRYRHSMQSKNHSRRHEDLHKSYNSPVLPLSGTIKSLQSSNEAKQNTSTRFCCCRTKAHSRFTVFFVFFLCILGAFAAFFCWPRTPRVSMGGGADSLSGSPDWWGGEKQPLPSSDTALPSRPSLRATWQINVTLDNRDNWVPTHLNQLDFVMVDSLTLAKFAWATTSGPMLLPPGVITPLSLTFNVNYQAADRTDPTFQNLYNACGPISESKQRPALNVILRVSFHIFGIMWTPLVTATPYTGGILCPTK